MKVISPEENGSQPMGPVPSELVALKERIQDQPPLVRQELEPLIDEVMEHAVFRSRVMLIARDALQRFRVEMAAMQFDLDMTKRERRMPDRPDDRPVALLRAGRRRVFVVLAARGRRYGEPRRDHPADIGQAFRRAIDGKVIGFVPKWIVEVDDVDGGDAGSNQREMVVHDFAADLAGGTR